MRSTGALPDLDGFEAMTAKSCRSRERPPMICALLQALIPRSVLNRVMSGHLTPVNRRPAFGLTDY